MEYVVLVLVAWGSLLLPLPSWLKGVMSVAVIGIGAVLLLFGLGGSYWDSHMRPGSSSAGSTILTGVLLLLSRAAHVMRLVLHVLGAPPGS